MVAEGCGLKPVTLSFGSAYAYQLERCPRHRKRMLQTIKRFVMRKERYGLFEHA